MKAELAATFIPLVILLLLSAFFSASETAVSSIPRTRLSRLLKSRGTHLKSVKKVLETRTVTVTTLLVGNNIVNIWASSLSTAFAISLYGQEGALISTGVMTVLILIFSEITPKTLASALGEKSLPTLAPIIIFFRKVLFIPVWAFSQINKRYLALLDRLTPENTHALTEEEIRMVMAFGKKEGVLEETEHTLLDRAFDFADRRIYEIMTTRTDIVAVEEKADYAEVLAAFRTHHYSRIPVYSDTIDHITGVIHYKDMLFQEPEANAGALSRQVLYVPETQLATVLLREMHKLSRSLAVALDEYGNTAGIVTIDDAVSSIFGGIFDEYDTIEKTDTRKIQVLSATHIKVPGDLKLEDLNALLRTDFDSEFYETIAGLIMEQAGRLPAKGEEVRHAKWVFKVEEISERRITRVDIKPDTKET